MSADVKNQIVWSLRDDVSAKARLLNNQLDSIGVKSKGASGLLGKFGNVTGGLITPMSLGASGALALGAGIFAVGRAAIDEEKNIAKLDASLRANVAGWDGNTDAIEDQIKARQDLAFSDDELRESLALLLTATKDVGKAQSIQATAMDLARLKGISLKEASEALIKVEAGQFRALKSMGIVLRDGATQTEALAAVQKVAGGQAKAFGETTEGAMQAAGIAIEDLAEDIGRDLVPAVKDAAVALREDIIPAIRDVGGILDTTVGGVSDLAVGLNNFTVEVGDFSLTTGKDFVGSLYDAKEAAAEMEEAMFGGRLELRRASAIVAATAGVVDGLAEVQRDLATDTERMSRKVTQSWASMRDDLVSDARDVVTGAYELLDDRANLAAANAEIAAARRVLASKNASAEEKRAARETLREVGETQAQLVIDLAEAGAAGSKTVKDAVKLIKEQLKTATGAEKVALTKTLQLLEDLEAQAKQTLGAIKKTGTYTGPQGGGYEHRAHGGPVEPGKTYTVGEQGEEKLVMGQTGGYVIPNTAGHESQGSVTLMDAAPRGGASLSGGGGLTVVFQSTWPPTTAQAREIATIVDSQLYYRKASAPR